MQRDGIPLQRSGATQNPRYLATLVEIEDDDPEGRKIREERRELGAGSGEARLAPSSKAPDRSGSAHR